MRPFRQILISPLPSAPPVFEPSCSCAVPEVDAKISGHPEFVKAVDLPLAPLILSEEEV